ncbi:MAG TPA: cation diffusion facilitator family transporter [Candidatus Syntrophosphaera sp.]|jgi:cation diffusion facilitator family transporter|nr:cation diffusion facilitator family transporter [Candidatus Syntrophosphaera sp.]HOH47902.1 cation diffusion facilitator family transporter [Candidatus Syntrophosphaera sp.]HPW38207.1 cation diffusion facilitator family transporter [Candidatus Syntrophosphaera sp.]HQC46452.1 cation diffusion facilitator family transporter [Candidatus Syntrophosphaera sp.]
MSDRDKITNRTVNFGLFTNVVLAVLKSLIGIIGHSQALLADGINSTSDVVYYVAVKIFMRQANKPADPEHPYGHRQLESISAIVVGAFIITTGIAIFFESINKVYDLATTVSRAPSSLWVLVIAAATLLTKIYLLAFTRVNHSKTGNPTLKALANDHLNDIMASGAVIVGVVAARLGLPWMDPAAGAIVALFIFKTGVSILMESSAELMDAVPDKDFGDTVRKIALSVEGVRCIEDMGVHRFGPFFTIEMTICVDGSITVEEGNAIAHRVEEKLLESYEGGLRRVMIHFHPETQHSHFE